MICAFPEIFCVKDKVYGERGPIEGKEDEEDDDREKREKALIKAVLKKGNVFCRFNTFRGQPIYTHYSTTC
jgi:hypothetical protein